MQRNGVESFAGDYVKSLIRFEDEIRQSKIEITEEAEEMLEQIHKYTGLPIKTKAATLDYLRSKGNLFFDSWEDVFNYFSLFYYL